MHLSYVKCIFLKPNAPFSHAKCIRPVRPEQEAGPRAVDRQEPALLQQARCVQHEGEGTHPSIHPSIRSLHSFLIHPSDTTRTGRKARGRFVGAQGSGDGAQKDAAKLDVASRVATQVGRWPVAKWAGRFGQCLSSS